MPTDSAMQAVFHNSSDTQLALFRLLTPARLTKYRDEVGGDSSKIAEYYIWNLRLSQALYLPLHFLEVFLRNKLDAHLTNRYSQNWHYDPRFTGLLKATHKIRIQSLVNKNATSEFDRKQATVSGLSFGFWIELLTTKFAVPLKWSTQLDAVFANLPTDGDLAWVATHLARARQLRNRISHHETIFTANLEQAHQDILQLIAALSTEGHAFVALHCTFADVLRQRPSA